MLAEIGQLKSRLEASRTEHRKEQQGLQELDLRIQQALLIFYAVEGALQLSIVCVAKASSFEMAIFTIRYRDIVIMILLQFSVVFQWFPVGNP